MEREAGAARVIAACSVDEQHVWRLRERAHRRLEQRSLTQGEQARLVRCARAPWHDGRLVADRGSHPRRVAAATRAAAATGETDEDGADPRSRSEPPRGRVERAEPQLLLDQLLERLRPRRHGRILAAWSLWWQRLAPLVSTTSASWQRSQPWPRADFVPAEWSQRADVDAPIPISHRQVTTQPSLVARMVEALALTGDERVLEIGTGYGWQTALLARLAREVFTVERFADLAETARTALAGHDKVTVVVGDGSEGLAQHAPFDAILVAAAPEVVPRPLLEQLAPGGRLVIPVGPDPDHQELQLWRKIPGTGAFDRKVLMHVRFVPLTGDSRLH